MELDPAIVAAFITLGGVFLGWWLGHRTQLTIARRQEARDLATSRRELYTRFLTIARDSLDHLAEGSLNRINGAVPRGAYSGPYFSDHQGLQTAMSGMELISSREVLDICRGFGELQWRFTTSEGEAEPVDRRELSDDEFRQLGEGILQKLRELGDVYSAFITAARRELNIPALSRPMIPTPTQASDS